MLNLYAVTVWHSSEPRHAEAIWVRTYTARRAEQLARESFPGCMAIAQPVGNASDHDQLVLLSFQATPRAA
jgi:hypothetical protein